MLPAFEFDEKILAQGAEISRKLDQLRQEKFPPDSKNTLRRFAMSEGAPKGAIESVNYIRSCRPHLLGMDHSHSGLD